MDEREIILDILRIINYQFDLLKKIPQYEQITTDIAVYRDITLADAELAVYESILLLESETQI